MIKWALYQGYCNPVLMICFAGLILHPSISWLLGLLAAYLFQITVLTWADTQCSIRHLTDAYDDILGAKNYTLHPVSNSITDSIQEFSSLKIYKKLPMPAQKMVGKHPWYADIYEEPLLVFVAEGKHQKSLSEPKAYTNFRGPSLVFLHHRLEELDLLDRFLLLHELEHVNLDGAMQLSRIYSRPVLLFFNLILLFFMASSWWHFPIISIYIAVNIVAHCQSIGKREVIADNGALLKLSNIEEQKEVVADLIELSFSILQGTSIVSEWMRNSLSFRPEEKRGILKEMLKISQLSRTLPKEEKPTSTCLIWVDRLLHFRWYEYKLKKGETIPYLGWSSFYDNVSAFPMSLFFFYLGCMTESIPKIPLLLMVLFIAIDVFGMQFGYMNQLLEIMSQIESKITRYDDKSTIA